MRLFLECFITFLAMNTVILIPIVAIDLAINMGWGMPAITLTTSISLLPLALTLYALVGEEKK